MQQGALVKISTNEFLRLVDSIKDLPRTPDFSWPWCRKIEQWCQLVSRKSKTPTLKIQSYLFPHTPQAWLLMPLCVLLWAARLVYRENAFPHTEQIKLFSLAWALMCSNKRNDCAKDFPHNLQGKGFSPVCVRICRVRSSDLANPLPHSLHKCLLAPSWTWNSYSIIWHSLEKSTFMCRHSVLALANPWLQILQMCLLILGCVLACAWNLAWLFPLKPILCTFKSTMVVKHCVHSSQG